MKYYYVYILASRRNGTLYTGVTSDLKKRVYEHKFGLAEGFTKKYNVKMLVWFDQTNDVYSALTREKQIKKWKRAYKVEMIEEKNPEWKDLFFEI